MNEKTVWGMHAGSIAEADTLFLKGNVVALGWKEFSDLTKIDPTREAFKAEVKQAFPDKKPGVWPNWAGQMFRFLHEMKMGDIVVYPSQADRKVHIGEITSDYQYRPQETTGFVHQRQVKWHKTVERIQFSQGALYEIGSAMSLFQVKNYAEEFLSALTGHQQISSPPDDNTAPSADELVQITKDYVLKVLSTNLKGFPLEEFVAQLLEKMGYRARVSQHGGDEGIDIIAHRDELGFEPPILKVQVKSRNDTVKQDEVAALFGRLAGANEVGLFVTLSSFAAQARSFARGKEKLRLIDGNELVELIFEHYEEFDSKYKGILPLRQVYIPDPEE